MDCEKLESLLMDELYGELDEVTSAAVKRHAAGCARCTALLDGFRVTRRLAAVPMVDLPDGLEDRILAMTQQAVVVVPFRRRAARAISLAGAWAMRPQTAMAAVFLVMIGTSVLLLRGRPMKDAAPASAPVTVTEEGSPAAEPAASAPAAARTPLPSPAGTPTALALHGLDDNTGREHPRDKTVAGKEEDGFASRALASAAPPPPPAAAAADTPIVGAVAGGAGAGGGDDIARGNPAEKKSGMSPFDAAVQSFQAGHYDNAARAFDALAPSDPAAVLWAARAVRDGKGCRAALQRFDQAAQRAAGTSTGWDALLEGARCYRSVGQAGQARTRLNALLNVDSHKDAARRELDILDAQSQSGGPNAAVRASKVAAPASPAPAPPPATAMPSDSDVSH